MPKNWMVFDHCLWSVLTAASYYSKILRNFCSMFVPIERNVAALCRKFLSFVYHLMFWKRNFHAISYLFWCPDDTRSVRYAFISHVCWFIAKSRAEKTQWKFYEMNLSPLSRFVVNLCHPKYAHNSWRSDFTFDVSGAAAMKNAPPVPRCA